MSMTVRGHPYLPISDELLQAFFQGILTIGKNLTFFTKDGNLISKFDIDYGNGPNKPFHTALGTNTIQLKDIIVYINDIALICGTHPTQQPDYVNTTAPPTPPNSHRIPPP